MPYCQVPSEKLDHMSLFGFTILHENDEFFVIQDTRGQAIVQKIKPVLWFEDIGDAIGMGATAIMIGGPE